jgi:putative transposase
MRKSKFSETQIVSALKEYEAGKSVGDICRDLGVNKQTFYNWNKKYGGMEAQDLKRLKELEEKYNRLQKMYSDLAMDNRILKDVIEKKL